MLSPSSDEQVLADGGAAADGFAIAGMLDWAHGPDACAEATAAWREMGGTHLALRVFDTLAGRIGVPVLGYTTVDEHLDALARFRDLAAGVLRGCPGLGLSRPEVATLATHVAQRYHPRGPA